ncbi:MAG: hypothetical protein CMF50_01170 [Legionellales bacterium]|nr:hypothetical protein [Legionellales bacterium]|tara:strand:+ start:5142 stop:5753 length:612 start_codon:yes stop_codon:yes gene_type:complete
MQSFFWGILLGWGAAIPIGPVNIEITRRALTFGPSRGLAMGLGACSADVLYIALLGLGGISLLQFETPLRVIGVLGALVLLWFAYNAFRQPIVTNGDNAPKAKPLNKHYRDGVLVTLLNPYTIIFWGSISSQLPALADHGHYGMLLACVGVMLGTVSWVGFLNTVIAITRHRLGPRFMRGLNSAGGVILVGFAGFGLWHSILG